MRSSHNLAYSPSRSGRPVRQRSVLILTWCNPLSCILGAPRYYSTSQQEALSHSRGAVFIHQIRSLHRLVSNRRQLFFGLGAGAAATDPFTGKARSRVPESSPCPLPGPEVLCNTARYGTDKVRARGRRTRPVKTQPIGAH